MGGAAHRMRCRGTGVTRRASGGRPELPGFWQRRWLERHFTHFSDAELAREARCSRAQVRAYLSLIGAERSATQTRRIARRPPATPPTCWTPSRVRQQLITPRTRSLDRRDALLIAAMFLASAIVYLATAARTVTGEDAGELLAAAHGLGVAHPPGYPLWTLLAHLFDIALPFGTVAWRVSLASALPAAAANALLLALGLKTLQFRLAAVAGAGAFAFSLTHWSQAAIPEVYGLNTALIAAMALLLLRFTERLTVPRLHALAAVAGVSCAHHTSAVPVAALAGCAALLVAPRLLRPKVVASALALAPLTFYAYLPWAASRAPSMNWGDPSSWDRFLAHVTRAQYAASEAAGRASSSYGEYLSRLGVLWGALLRQFGASWVALLGLVGFFTLAVRRTGPWLFLMAVGWLCSVGITQYASYSLGREHVYAVSIFFIPAWMVLSWLVAGGLDAALLAARSRLSGRGVGTAAFGSTALLIGLPVVVNWPHVDRSETSLVAEYGRALLDTMEPGALYFPSSDHSTFSVLYWQGVEGYRTDVVVADKYGSIDADLLAEHLTAEELRAAERLPGPQRRARWEALLIQRWPAPVYFAGRRVMADLPGRSLEPCGPLFRVMTTVEAEAWWATPSGDAAAAADQATVGLPVPAGLVQSGIAAALDAPGLGPPDLDAAGLDPAALDPPDLDPPGLAVWQRLSHLDLADPVEGLDFTVQMIRGDLHAMKGFALLAAGRLEAAQSEWAAIEGDLAPLKQTFNNIGSALADHGLTAEALAYYDLALAEDPGYVLALRNAAAVHSRRGEGSAAIETLRQLVSLDPSSRSDRLALARALGGAGRIEAALMQYEGLARRDLRDPLPWREAGRLLEQGGDFSKASEAYAESLARDPEQPTIALALDRLAKGVTQLLAQLPPGLADPSAPAPSLGEQLLLHPNRIDFGGPALPRLPGSGASVAPQPPRPPTPNHTTNGP